MKKLILTAVSIIIISGAHGYASSKDDVYNENKQSVTKADAGKNGNTVKPVEVKNIWKDMPGYDKYGNEITPRMRYNMQQNALLNSKTNQNNSNGENK